MVGVTHPHTRAQVLFQFLLQTEMATPVLPEQPSIVSVGDVVTADKTCVGGVRLHNVGILDDPVPGSKMGKGLPHHNSSYWVQELGTFIDENVQILLAFIQEAEAFPPGARVYFLNQSNAWFMQADKTGLRTNLDGTRKWMMASWLAMMATEYDSFPFTKYTATQKAERRTELRDAYADAANAQTSGLCRVDLIPPTAFERLSLHNELSALKYGEHALDWKNKGFVISERINSVKRHLDQAHNKDHTEDHMAHLVWNLMAIFHVAKVFPQYNDMVNYEALREKNNHLEQQRLERGGIIDSIIHKTDSSDSS